MPDNLSPENRRKAMRAVKSKGTSPERILWAMLAGMRVRGWRKNAVDVPGKPDVVLDEKKIAIFVDGCFWHGCPVCKKPLPEHDREYWEKKISRNAERDKMNTKALLEEEWTVVRIWEHEIVPAARRATVRKRIHDLTTFDQAFIILAQAAIPFEPYLCALTRVVGIGLVLLYSVALHVLTKLEFRGRKAQGRPKGGLRELCERI